MTILRTTTLLAIAQLVAGSQLHGQVIGALDREARRVDRSLGSLRKSTQKLVGRSTEGGELLAYWAGRDLRLLVATYYGETGRAAYRYYYASDTVPFLILRLEERYDRPMSGHVVRRMQQRAYIRNDRLVASIVVPKGADSIFHSDQQLQDQLRLARTFRQCATEAAPEC